MTEDNWWSSSQFATAASAKAAAAPARVKPTSQDMQMLRDSTRKAEAERSARRTYASVRDAVRTMDTSPSKASFMDAITPEDGGDAFDKIGGFFGTPFRAAYHPETKDARDHLKTVMAQVALRNAKSLPGPASDKDTALIRMAGVSDYKGVKENLDILRNAERESAIEQHRATLKSKWISQYGSIAAPGPRGMSYEEIAARQEAMVNKAMDIRERGLPKPPPSKRSRGPVEIDLNGRPVR